MPVSSHWSYFDHAAVAPLSGPARDAILRWSDQAAQQGDTLWPEWHRQYENARILAAEMIGASSEEIAFVASTTAGIHLVAEGFPWNDGDNVVVLDNEFPSNLHPWLHLASRGVETRRVPVAGGVPDLQRIAETMDHRTRLVSLSWVGYASGYRLNVAETAKVVHERGALFFLDAIQGLGVYPLDVVAANVDFLAADGHKWMLGPEGAGVFYGKRELLDQLRPLGVGWNSVQNRYDFANSQLVFRPEAARYEGGSPNHVGVLALGASLKLLKEMGVGPHESEIGQRVDQLVSSLANQLEAEGAVIRSPRIAGHESGILVFELPKLAPPDIRSRCLENGIVVSCRGGGVRLSPHAYNSEDDVQRLMDVVRRAYRGSR